MFYLAYAKAYAVGRILSIDAYNQRAPPVAGLSPAWHDEVWISQQTGGQGDENTK